MPYKSLSSLKGFVKMKVGIVSDSHGKVSRLKRALEVLIARGAEIIVHCGDVGSEDCIVALADANLPCFVVAGNMDKHVDRFAIAAKQTGVNFDPSKIIITLDDGQRLAITHGNDGEIFRQLLADDSIRYICTGHTHKAADERIGQKRLINPGALRHAHPTTVAMLDTQTDTVEHIRIK